MYNQTLTDATDLNQWSNRNEAATILPRLVRRLISVTARDITLISVRAGDGVSIGGWDALLETSDGNEFVPEGKSVWEVGKEKGVKGKADKDYEKRKAEPDCIPSENTYVFVTSRRWGGKEKWVKEKNKDRFWKEVKALDADDLETWFESALSVHIWFSILLGKHPETAVDLSSYWEQWTTATTPPISSKLVIAGREVQVNEVISWLRGASSVCPLQATSQEEAISFLASVIETLEEQERETYFARCVVVEDVTSWRRLLASQTPLILIPNFTQREGTPNASSKGHHVFIPLGNEDNAFTSTIILPRPHRESIKQALLDMGIQEQKADELATLGRRSILALRRKLSNIPEVQCPSWATPSLARELVPFLLVGKWKDSNEADQEILAKLARTTYEQVNNNIAKWANVSDPPIRRIGDTWMLTSSEDAWALLSRYLTREDMDNFEAVVLEVLAGASPSLELPISERWMANILGKNLPHSGFLREGLVETLALMAARSDVTRWQDASSAQERANRVVWKLLEQANQDWKVWASISDLLPRIAEAAPTTFLEAVEKGLSGDEPLLMNLFAEDSDSLFGGGSYHTALLWALEVLAWHPDYLSRVALILAKLTRLDPGGRLANRPSKSLHEIFLSWHPQTLVSLERRVQVIDAIRKKEPDIAWQLMTTLLPEDHNVAFPTAQPKWREWGTEFPPQVTWDEVGKFTTDLVNRMIKDVSTDGKRWCELLQAVARLPKAQCDDIISAAQQLNVNSFTPDDQMMIWKNIRSIISSHREYADAEWAMPVDMVNQLELIYDQFTPTNPTDRYSWLFENNVDLINPAVYQRDDWEAREQLIQQMRLAIIQKLYAEGGLSLCIEIAEKIENPQIIGYLVGKNALLEDGEDSFLTNHLTSEQDKYRLIGSGYVWGRFQTNSWLWVEEKMESCLMAGWIADSKATFYLSLPFSDKTWDLMESIDEPDTKDSYWDRINPGFDRDIDYERVTRNLLKQKRPHVAVHFLVYYTREDRLLTSPDLAADVLEQLLAFANEQSSSWGNIGYSIALLMKVVRNSQQISKERIVRLEWNFLPFLERYSKGPKFLHQELASNPDFFVELIKLIFISKSKEPEIFSDEDRPRKAAQAWSLLNSWHICPGGNDKGELDRDALWQWVTQARQELQSSGRGVIGDQQIGQALAESSFGTDGAFPHEFIRDLIEEIASPAIERGFEVRVMNNRGVTSRLPTDGGGLERNEADRYKKYAETMGAAYPRTVAMMRRITDNYLGHARREDMSAELTEDLWR